MCIDKGGWPAEAAAAAARQTKTVSVQCIVFDMCIDTGGWPEEAVAAAARQTKRVRLHLAAGGLACIKLIIPHVETKGLHRS